MSWTLPLLLAAHVLPSCGSDEGGGTVCNPGDLRRCPCSATEMGEQTCNSEGTGYDECICGTGVANGGSGGAGGSSSSTGGSSSSSAGSSSMPPAAMFTSVVGSPCTTDGDCGGDPMFCITSTSSDIFLNQAESGTVAGGPQGGYCSARCTTNNNCTALDELSACNNALGICMAVCLPGPGNLNAKCGANRAQACLPISADGGLGICIPRCTSDTACGAGRFCDTTLFGMCVDAQRPGGGVGAPCSPETEETDCASGLCIQYSDPVNRDQVAGSFCSANCTAGINAGCGFDEPTDAAGGVRQAACFSAQFQGGGIGDLGYCAPLCDTTADCPQAADGWVCEPFPEPNIAAQVGRAGECVPGALATVGASDAGPG